MISRRTIFSFLLMALLGVGIRLWSLEHQTDCDRFVKGDRTVPSSQYVDSGSQTIEIPCRQWLPRQPVGLQMLCLADVALALVFGLNAFSDVRDGVAARRRRRAGMRI